MARSLKIDLIGSMKRYAKREVLRVYEHHPLQQRTILDRVRAVKGTLIGLVEKDLAVDNATELTDQNHVGGIKFVKELAREAGINSETKVLDLGCGLGGSARVLAAEFGCRVHGIDFSRKRFREARHLTTLVGLGELVTFECSDLMTARVPLFEFDVLWDQSSWIHIADKKKFIRRWSRALKSDGRIALEDAFLEARTLTRVQSAMLMQLEEQWKSYLISAKQWCDLLQAECFTVYAQADLTLQMREHFETLAKVSNSIAVPKKEVAAWHNAIHLTESGVLYYGRIIAKRSAPLWPSDSA
jgi:ubiquinone/menaquinone biosynthesis C-methylase UbiE